MSSLWRRVPSTSLLFFLRLRAVFLNNRIVVGIFAFLWLSTVAGSITVPLAVRGGHIGNTNRCINVEVKAFSSAAPVTNTVNSTLVFIAVSLRLLSANSLRDQNQSRMRSFVKAESGSRISRALLQGGQLYYVYVSATHRAAVVSSCNPRSATVGLNIVTVVMVLVPTVPAVFHAMFTVPNVALENAMACRVFRKLKFGTQLEPGQRSTGVASVSEANRTYRHDLESSGHQLGVRGPVRVEVLTDVRRDYDSAERVKSDSDW